MFNCCGLWEAGSKIPGDLFFWGVGGAELGEVQMNEHRLKLSTDGHIKIEWFSVLPVPTLLISARLHVFFKTTYLVPKNTHTQTNSISRCLLANGVKVCVNFYDIWVLQQG